MKLGVGGKLLGVHGGISTRGFGVGLGPLSVGSSWGRSHSGLSAEARSVRSTAAPTQNVAPGPAWINVLSLGMDAVFIVGLVRAIRQFRRRAVDPDRQDPARLIYLLIIWGCPVLALGVVAANIAVFDKFGLTALFPAVTLDVVAAVGLIVSALYLWHLAEARRRCSGYVICEASYVDAPHHVKSTMRHIYKSARSVRSGRAYQDRMLGDGELDRLVYSAAERAVLASELSAAVRDLAANAEPDDDAVNHAKEQLGEIRRYLDDVEGSLARAAKTATSLSGRISEPEAARAAQRHAEEMAATAAENRRQARMRLEDATARASSPARVDGSDVEDRVSSVYAGYDEVTRISNDVLYGPVPVAGEDDSKPLAREAVWKVAKSTAAKTRRFSASAFKLGADKLRKRSAER